MTSILLLMPLLNEGTTAWRPVAVEPNEGCTFRVLGPVPEDEKWAFPPGSIVASELKTFSGGEEKLVAVALDQAAPTRQA